MIDKESCGEIVHTALRESCLCADEGLVHAHPQGEVVDALLAVVIAALEHLGICVVHAHDRQET